MSTHIIGDQVEGIKYWSMVDAMKNELERIYAKNNPFMQTWKQLSADVKVHIFLQQGKASAIIYAGVGGYMESGILDMLGFGRGNRNTYVTAKVRFTDRVSLLQQRYYNASPSRKLSDGDQSYAAGCPPEKRLDHVDIYNDLGEIIYSFDSPPEAPEFCDADKIKARKDLMEALPASVFTGRMRDYIQAIYGTRRTDFTGSFTIAGWKLTFDTGDTFTNANGEQQPILVELYPTTNTLICLQKLGDGKFALITNEGADIVARLMVAVVHSTSPEAKDADPRIIDSYELSGLRPSSNKVVIGTMPAYPEFRPLYYGWHANLSGTKASVALFHVKDITGTRKDGSVNTRLGWGCILATLEITVARAVIREEMTLTGHVALTVTAEKDIFPYDLIKIFYPNTFAPDKMTIAYTEFADTYIDTSDVPLYAYYQEDDLKVVYGSGSAFTPASNFTTPDPGWHTSIARDIFGVGACWDANAYSKEGITATVGGLNSNAGSLSLGSVVFSGNWSQRDSVTYQRITLAPGTQATSPAADITCGGNPANTLTDAITHFWDQTGGSFHESSIGAGFSAITIPSLVVPYNDSQCVFLSLTKKVDASFGGGQLGWFGNNVAYFQASATRTGYTTTGGSAIYAEAMRTAPTDFPALTALNKDFIPNEAGELWVFNSFTPAAGIKVATTDDATVGPYILDLFSPPHVASDPTLEVLFEAWASIGGSVKFGIQRNWYYTDWPDDITVNGGPIGYA